MNNNIPIAYAVRQEQTSPVWADAFALGCGGIVCDDDTLHPGNIALFGSRKRWGMLRQAQAEGRDWYYSDHGFFGQGVYYRCARNSFSPIGDNFLRPWQSDYDRWDNLNIVIARWRLWTKNKPILVCPPSEDFAPLHGFSGEIWTLNILSALEKITNRTIIIRDRRCEDLLIDALSEAHVVVTYVSNIAVDSLIAGVPVICTGVCAGGTMGGKLENVDEPPKPKGRRDWAARLAANQWTLDEMRNGDLWNAIGDPARQPKGN